MATVQTNQTPMRWLNGGVLKITGATDTYEINNIHDGAISFNLIRRDKVDYKDRGVWQAPIEGDDELGECSVEVFCGALAVGAGTALQTLLTADGSSSTNLALEYASIIFDFPVSRGGSTGQRVTLTNCAIKQGVMWEKGEKQDTLKFSFNFRSQTIATY